MDRARLKKFPSSIALLVSDVDGVLTDAGMYYSSQGDIMKKFNTRDGMGFTRWHEAGFKSCLMTQETSDIVLRRGEKLRIHDVRCGVLKKGAAIKRLIASLGLTRKQVAYIGDDINDLPAFEEVGFRMAPANAMPMVKKKADYVCRLKGGEGAVRECIDLLLAAKGIR